MLDGKRFTLYQYCRFSTWKKIDYGNDIDWYLKAHQEPTRMYIEASGEKQVFCASWLLFSYATNTAHKVFIWARMDDILMFNITQKKMIKHMSKYLFLQKYG